MSHGDEVYDIIEEQDKSIVQYELLLNGTPSGSSTKSSSLLEIDERCMSAAGGVDDDAAAATEDADASSPSASRSNSPCSGTPPLHRPPKGRQASAAERAATNSDERLAAAIASGASRLALCRMNVSRSARRQMRFGDQKVVLIEGHFFGHLPLSSRNEPVFVATCRPVAMPETRECVVQGATDIFTTIHSLDMKLLHTDAL